MGDITNIKHLCQQVIEIQEYRGQLYEYLKNRMLAIAPNLTVLVGELVGARLIAHAGSLMNLAKHPASTVQILGAEKALFKALKTKHDTPKYGLIYHAQLVGQASSKMKGKVSRMLAAKAALACRVDALGDELTLILVSNTGLKLSQESGSLREELLQRSQEKRCRVLSSTSMNPRAKLSSTKLRLTLPFPKREVSTRVMMTRSLPLRRLKWKK